METNAIKRKTEARGKLRALLALAFALAALTLCADDGTITVPTSGSQVIPMKNTDISLDFERLYFRMKGDYVEITVELVFNNRGGFVELPLAFIIPPVRSGLAGSMENGSKPNITIRTTVNGESVSHDSVTTAAATAFSSNGDYAWTYKAKFAPGLNYIRHDYAIPSGSSWDALSSDEQGHMIMVSGMYYGYSYCMRTGAAWKGGKIGRIDIYFENQGKFWISGADGLKAEYIGAAKSAGTSGEYIATAGTVKLVGSSFAPTQNIEVGFVNENTNEYTALYGEETPDPGEIDWLSASTLYNMASGKLELDTVEDAARKLPKETLRVMRNALFAWYGYVFKDAELRGFFNACWWYTEVPSIAANMEILDQHQKALFNIISAAEAKK